MASKDLPEELRTTTFTTAQALRLGVGAERLRRSDLTSHARGTRSPADGDPWRAKVEAALAVAPQGSVLSHFTALRSYGIDVFYDANDDGVTHLWLPPGSHRIRRPNIDGRRTNAPVPQRIVDGLPTTPLPRTFVDLVDVERRPNMLVAFGDAIVANGVPRESLQAEVDRSVGRRNVTIARDAVRKVRVGAESPYETLVRLRLVEAGADEPVLQHKITLNRTTYRADLAWPQLRLIVEYLGLWHHEQRERWERDQRRTNALQSTGFHVQQVTRDMLFTAGDDWIDAFMDVYERRLRASKQH